MIKIKKFPFAPKGDGRLDNWAYLAEAEKMNKYIRNGDVVYDCGANIFDHTVFFAINNPNSKIVAFEPIKEYFEMGLENAKYFNVNNVIPMNVALGERSMDMNISVSNEGSSLVFDHKNAAVESIKVESIDYLVENGIIPSPNVIKIDVEGFALPLIMGAKKTIEKYKPIVIVEIHPQFVGDDASMQKLQYLQMLGLNIEKRIALWHEYVLSSSKSNFSITTELTLHKVQKLRDAFEKSVNKNDRKEIIETYKKLSNNVRIPILRRMIWSRLYVIFSSIFTNKK